MLLSLWAAAAPSKTSPAWWHACHTVDCTFSSVSDCGTLEIQNTPFLVGFNRGNKRITLNKHIFQVFWFWEKKSNFFPYCFSKQNCLLCRCWLTCVTNPWMLLGRVVQMEAGGCNYTVEPVAVIHKHTSLYSAPISLSGNEQRQNGTSSYFC